MAQKVKMPDGAVVSFPDDMPKEEIRALIEDKFPDAAGSGPYASTYGPDGPPSSAKPGSKEYADWAMEQAKAGKKLPQVSSTEDKFMLPIEQHKFRRSTFVPVVTNETTDTTEWGYPQALVDLYSAVTLPGDVLAGKVDPMSREGTDRAAMFGMTFAGGGAALPGKMSAAEAPAVLAKAAAPKAGYSRPATEAVVRGLIADGALGDEGMKRLGLSGEGAMLSDAGPATRAVLDTAIQRSGPGATTAREAVEARAAQAGPTVERALDEALGTPDGVQTAETAIRQGSAGARDATYKAAYEQPIDYSSEAGMAIEGLTKRVPKPVIDLANRMMQLEGEQSAQILAKVADDGTVTFLRQPDVRQLDYITRALNMAAKSGEGQGALGGQTDIGRLFGNLARDIRNQVRDAVPEYDTALRTAADPIRRREALKFGAELLSPSVARDVAREEIAAMTGPELRAAQQGLRSLYDETLANVKATISDPNIDSRQARKALQDLSSPAAREKVRMILKDDAAADKMFAELLKAQKALELKADVATNSKTFGRLATEEAIDSQVTGGPVNSALRGEPINAARAFIQSITGRTPKGEQAMKDAVYEEIAKMLTGPRGAEAMDLLKALALAKQKKTASLAKTTSPALPSTLLPLAEMTANVTRKASGATLATGR